VNRPAAHSAESHPPIADTQPVRTGKFSVQRFEITLAGFTITRQHQLA
jgi:hypothetical protein